MILFTIGFTQRPAQQFFETLVAAGVTRVIDVRLRSGGQLSGFAKAPDLAYFLGAIAGIGYERFPALAPTPELLARYRAHELDWDAYAGAYRDVLEARRPERDGDPRRYHRACLLCSERASEHCHRRIAAAYLANAFAPGITTEIVHL